MQLLRQLKLQCVAKRPGSVLSCFQCWSVVMGMLVCSDCLLAVQMGLLVDRKSD